MTVPCKQIFVPNYQQIANNVYDYIVQKTNILDSSDADTETLFWNWLTMEDVLINVPLLAKWVETTGATPRNMAILCVRETLLGQPVTESSSLHVDVDKSIRVLWPIRNCKGSSTHFYDVPREYLEYRETARGVGWLYVTQPGPFKFLGKGDYDLGPFVFDPNVAHGIHVEPDAGIPRLTLTIGFDADSDKSKTIDAW